MSTDPDITLNQDARSWRSTRLGDVPLVPEGIHQQGPLTVVAAGLLP